MAVFLRGNGPTLAGVDFGKTRFPELRLVKGFLFRANHLLGGAAQRRPPLANGGTPHFRPEPAWGVAVSEIRTSHPKLRRYYAVPILTASAGNGRNMMRV